MANTFKHSDRVKTVSGSRTGGRVYLIACALATAKGGKICDPKTCKHADKDYVWVLWPGNNKSFSYPYTDLEIDTSPPTTEEIALKDDYLERAKQTIKDVLKPKEKAPEEKKQTEEFWRLYNGFDKVKYDRNGRPFLHETKAVEDKPALKEEEIDWKKYHGFTRSKTYRKDA